jgi:RHS repeat-associated protein
VYNLASYNTYSLLALKRPSASSVASPFGSSLPNRAWSDVSRVYRYGFNGKEKDSETANDNYDFGARIYEGRLGRWLSLDPLIGHFVEITPYNFCVLDPINLLDDDGKQAYNRPSYRNYRHVYRIPPRPEIRKTTTYERRNNPNLNLTFNPPRPTYVTNRPGFAGGQFNQSPIGSVATELLLDMGDTKIKISKSLIIFDKVEYFNNHGISVVEVIPYLPQQSAAFAELNKKESSYKNGLVAIKKEFVQKNEPKWNKALYDKMNDNEKACYKRYYNQQKQNYFLSLKSNMAGIEIQYRMQNGISPMEKFRLEAMKMYNNEKSKYFAVKQSIIITPVIYNTQH